MGKSFFIILSSIPVLFYSLAAQTDTAANSKTIFEPSFNIYSGLIVKNYPDVPKNFLANYVSVNFSFKTNGARPWHRFYKFPKLGAETVFGIFNSKELGYVVGLVPNMEFRNEKNFTFKIGFGAAYFNKPFDLVNNPKNFYIGYPFTNMTYFSFGHLAKLNSKLTLQYGLTTLHCSDGHTSLPNAGLNCFLVNVGLTATNVRKSSGAIHKKDSIKSKPVFTLRAGLGLHEFGETTKAIGGPSYPSYHFAFSVSKPIKNIHVLDAGLVWSYYTSFHDYIVNQEVYKNNIDLRSSTGVIFAGHEFVFGKFGFSTQFGIYFYNPFFIQQKKIDGSWSSFGQKLEAINTNRVGILFYPFKKKNTLNKMNNTLMMGMYIKANLGQADLFEYVLGYRF